MSERSGFSLDTPIQGRLITSIRLDPILLVCIGIVLIIGLVVMSQTLSDRPNLFLRHGTLVFVGFFFLVGLAQINKSTIQDITPLLYVGTLGLLVAVLLFGDSAKGATRWLDLPGFPRFQPSELLKLVLPLSVAWYLKDKSSPLSFVDSLVCVIIIVLPLGLVYLQPDLGTTVLIGLACLGVVFMAGLKWRWTIATALLSVTGFIVAWQFILSEYQMKRITTFLNPEAEPLGAGWNIMQSKIALGSGGIFGKGLGEGTQSQLSFLPEGHTDFILSVIGEELGFLGTVTVLTFFFFIFARAMIMGRKATTRFGQLAIVGITLMYFGFMAANTLMVVGMLPVVGAPLPLVSYGGTSIITYLAAFGIVIALYDR